MAKHNKKRNTAFIYEALVREVIRQTIKKDTPQRNKAIKILKENFGKNSEAKKELELYKVLLHTRGLDEKTAEKVVSETIRQYKNLNHQQIFAEQSAIIATINKEFSKGVFNNFVPNYKNLATISQIFNDSLNPKNKVLLENKIVATLTSSKSNVESEKPSSNLITQTFVKRFNDTYNHFLGEQKELLSKYIFSFEDDGAEFNFYLSEEIGRLKEILQQSQTLSEIKEDVNLQEKITKVISLLNETATKSVTRETLIDILKIQDLTRELQS
tara:strand:- start:23 stop:835 length:813 start_codon:yes stop_codon:yes gene_type:complete